MVKYGAYIWWEWNGKAWRARYVIIKDGHQIILG